MSGAGRAADAARLDLTPDTRHPTPGPAGFAPVGAASRAAFDRATTHNQGPPRLGGPTGFTLVELLVTITIIGVLAGLVLGVATVAAENAREQHTRHVVARLHTLLTDHYETYKTRRIKVNPAIISQINNQTNWTAAEKGRAIAEARMYALRELMLMEMPDRWSDVTLPKQSAAISNPVFLDAPATAIQASGVTGPIRRTELAAAYLRRALRNPTDEHQSAECLYLIITLACGDGEARSLFGENTIADTDGDGAPEFVDGWKRPIRFLRWAPGFDSQIQVNANLLETPTPRKIGQNQLWESQASSDHDPFDMFRVDPAAFRLVPLIFSLGRDEESGIDDASPRQTWPLKDNGGGDLNMTVQVSQQAPHITSPVLSPYLKGISGYPDNYLGTQLSAEATDNIHNHLMGLR